MCSPEVRQLTTGLSSMELAALQDHWGGLQQRERLFSGLSATLANESLTALPAELFVLVPHLTWGHVADAVSLAKCKWKHGTKLSTGLATQQTVWLLLGGGTPSPKQIHSGFSSILDKALSRGLRTRFEKQAEAHRKKYQVGEFEARRAIARIHPWSFPVPTVTMRSIMMDPNVSIEMVRTTLWLALFCPIPNPNPSLNDFNPTSLCFFTAPAAAGGVRPAASRPSAALTLALTKLESPLVSRH